MSIDNEEIQGAIDEAVDIYLKISSIALFAAFDELTAEIMMNGRAWADESNWLSTGLEMPRGAFEAFIAYSPLYFAGSIVEPKTQLEEDDGKWYIVLDVLVDGFETDAEGMEDDPYDEPGAITITLEFARYDGEWLIDCLQLHYLIPSES